MWNLKFAIAVGAACSAHYLSHSKPTIFSYLKSSFVGTLLLLLYLFLWHIILYPLYFSPYLTLPQAPQSKSWKRVFTSIRDGDILLDLYENTPNGGMFRALDTFNREMLVVTAPQSIKEILQSRSYDYEKAPLIKKFLEAFLGNGLVTVDGDEHKHQRKAMNPAFSFRHIKELYPLFWLKASELVSLIKSDIEKPGSEGIIDMSVWAARAALDIVGLAGFGLDFASLTNPDNKLSKAYQDALQPDETSRAIYLLSMFVPARIIQLLPLKKTQEVRKGIIYIRKYIRDVIVTKHENKTHKDIVSVAINYGGFTTDGLVDQSQTFLGAGHETTTTSLTWAIYALTQPENLHIQQRLREEIREHLPSPSSQVEMSSEVLDSLKYLDAVCKEVLRVYSPVFLIGRVASRDTRLGEVVVKKGGYVIVPIWAINRSKQFWGENARDFDPERWLEGPNRFNGGADPMAFQTFGYGTRQCIGKNFATAEFKALLATLVGSFEMSKAEDKELRIDWSIVARIYQGYKVRLEPVEGW